MFANSPDEIIPALETFKPQVLVVYDDGFNYLTKMCLSNMREAAFQMQHIAKKFGCKVIMTSLMLLIITRNTLQTVLILLS